MTQLVTADPVLLENALISICEALGCQPVEEEALAAIANLKGGHSQAIVDVVVERGRHITGEGWTPEHDDEYVRGELVFAGAAYALHTSDPQRPKAYWLDRLWPWAWDWWKPKDPRRNMVRAAALFVAEIERMDRAVAKETADA